MLSELILGVQIVHWRMYNTPAKRNCSCGKARKRIALSPQTPPNFTKKPCSGIVNLREFLILIPGEAVKVNKKSAHAQLAQMQ